MGCSLLNNYNQHNDVVIPQLGPHWPLISCVLSSLGRLGPARAEVGLSFAVVGWFRRFCLPPLRWFCSVFSCPFRACPLRARCVGVGVFFLPLLLRSPPRVLVKYFPFHLHVHLILIPFASSPSLHLSRLHPA